MTKDLVLGIDSSTTATKAIAFDRAGVAVAEGRANVPLHNPKPGHFEQDARDWWKSTVQAIRELAGKVDLARIAAVAIANQRETFVPLDEHDEPVRPGTVWLDERATAEVDELVSLLGADTIRELIGKPCDVICCIYRVLWMKKNEPELFKRFRRITEVHSYLVRKLTGEFRTSAASADPAGFLDLAAGVHATKLINSVGLDVTNFPDPLQPGELLGHITPEAASATGLKSGTPVIAGGGDGQCAGTGVNIFVPNRAYVNMGTALVSGMFSETYATNLAFRTMGAVAERGYIFESCNRSGTFLVNWFVNELFGAKPSDERSIYSSLEEEARAAGIGAGGVMLLPYWSGVMSPYWRSDARGAIAGLGASHKRGHVYRALLEGLSLEQTLATNEAARAAGKPVDHYVAIGGGSNSDLWCQILADASGRNVVRSSTVEASALGAAMAAAKGAGWYSTIPEASAAMAGAVTRRFEPDSAAHARYSSLLGLYSEFWPMIADWNAKLVALNAAGGQP